MRCQSLLLRLEPSREIVERDVQCCCQLRKRAKAAGFAAGFDLAQIARRDAGGSGKRLPGEAAMGSPNRHRMLTVDQAADELARQIIGPRLFLAERTLARLDLIEKSVVLGVLDALDQRLVFRAGQGHDIGLLAHRYISLRCSTRSNITVSAVRSIRQTARQFPCRTRTRSSWLRSGRAARCGPKGSAAKASTRANSASPSGLGNAARSLAAPGATINLTRTSSTTAVRRSTTAHRQQRRREGPPRSRPQSSPGRTRSSNEPPRCPRLACRRCAAAAVCRRSGRRASEGLSPRGVCAITARRARLSRIRRAIARARLGGGPQPANRLCAIR